MRAFDWKSLLRYESGAILMILCGVILTVKPDAASAVISALLGWVLIAAGVAALIAGLADGIHAASVAVGAVLLIAGAWLHRHPLLIASFLGVVLGVLVLSQSWRAMRDAQRIKRCGGLWIPGAVLAVLELLVGLRLILSPLSLTRLVLTIAGIVMIVCGACSLVAHYRSVKYIPDSDGIIDADE